MLGTDTNEQTKETAQQSSGCIVGPTSFSEVEHGMFSFHMDIIHNPLMGFHRQSRFLTAMFHVTNILNEVLQNYFCSLEREGGNKAFQLCLSVLHFWLKLYSILRGGEYM